MKTKDWEREFESLKADYNFVWFAVLQVYATTMNGFLFWILNLLSYYFLLLYFKGKIRATLWNFGKKKIINTKAGSEK